MKRERSRWAVPGARNDSARRRVAVRSRLQLEPGWWAVHPALEQCCVVWLDIGQVSSEPREAGSQSVGQVRLCRGTFVSERIDHDLKQPSGSAGPCIRRHLVLFGSSPDGATESVCRLCVIK